MVGAMGFSKEFGLLSLQGVPEGGGEELAGVARHVVQRFLQDSEQGCCAVVIDDQNSA